jgi:hypothetical protein
LANTRFISPLTFGIPFKKESQTLRVDQLDIKRKASKVLRNFDTTLCTSEFEAEQNLAILDEVVGKDKFNKYVRKEANLQGIENVPMVWDRHLHKLCPLRPDI